MKNFTMFVFVLFCVPAVAEAQQLSDGEARALVCGPGEIQVCTEPSNDGGFNVMYRRGSPLLDCSVASDRGIGLRCVARSEVCTTARTLCEQRSDVWRWNESDCRCDYHRTTTTPTTPTTATPPTTTPTTPTTATPPVQPGSAPACPDCDQCSTEELRQILNSIAFIEQKIDDGAALVLTEEEIRALRAEAENLREQANECRNEALADRATTLVAALDPYRPEFVRLHQHLDALDFTVEDDENWCTGSFGGVLACIVLPTVAAGAAIFLGVWFGTEWSVTQD
ncbi:MAG: hypothetical protein WC445_04380 [Patescibacteria group bacterium]